MAAYTDPLFLSRLADLLRVGPWTAEALKKRAWFAFPDDRRLIGKVLDATWERFGGQRPSGRVWPRS